MTTAQTIGVIGAGTMGNGIAHVCALAGLSVVMLDVDEKRVTKGRDAIASGLERLVKKSKLSAADRDAALGRLRATTDYGALADGDFIVEAATEDEALKLKILRQVDAAPVYTLSGGPVTSRSGVLVTGRDWNCPRCYK